MRYRVHNSYEQYTVNIRSTHLLMKYIVHTFSAVNITQLFITVHSTQFSIEIYSTIQLISVHSNKSAVHKYWTTKNWEKCIDLAFYVTARKMNNYCCTGAVTTRACTRLWRPWLVQSFEEIRSRIFTKFLKKLAGRKIHFINN